MNPTGSWLALDIERNAKFEVGFIPFPAPDGPGIFSGGLGSGTFVNATTKHADAAIKFLDYGMTPEHGRWAVENLQDIPAYPVDTAGIKASPLFKQILDDSAKIADGTGDFGYNIDVLTTDAFNNAMWKGMQGLLTDQTTPGEGGQPAAGGVREGEEVAAWRVHPRCHAVTRRAQARLGILLTLPVAGAGGDLLPVPDGQRPLLRRGRLRRHRPDPGVRRAGQRDRDVHRSGDLARPEQQRDLDRRRHRRTDDHRPAGVGVDLDGRARKLRCTGWPSSCRTSFPAWPSASCGSGSTTRSTAG